MFCIRCGKEIPDDSNFCPACGISVMQEPNDEKENNSNANVELKAETNVFAKNDDHVEENNLPAAKNRNVNKMTALFAAIGIVVLAAIGIFYIANGPKATYDKALGLLEDGKYKEADQLLTKIEDYQDVSAIREQIPYETYACSGLRAIQEVFSDGTSLDCTPVVYDIFFYKAESEYPACFIEFEVVSNYNNMNTSGKGYTVAVYDEDARAYSTDIYSRTLNPDEAEDAGERFSAYVLGYIKDNKPEIGSVNVDRLNSLIKNGKYLTVKLMDPPVQLK